MIITKIAVIIFLIGGFGRIISFTIFKVLESLIFVIPTGSFEYQWEFFVIQMSRWLTHQNIQYRAVPMIASDSATRMKSARPSLDISLSSLCSSAPCSGEGGPPAA